MNTEKKRILVVDDELPVREVTCRYLEDAQFECVSVGTGRQAVQVTVAGLLADLLVIDIRLPDIPGPEVALLLHDLRPQIPVLFISGWTEGLARPDRLAPLRWEFLAKPFSGAALVGGVQRLLAEGL
jgi:CheY-like chemotaxis protein